jgi:hypothetical protein
LPPYEILDQILQLYVEENLSARDIIARGFDENCALGAAPRVDLNEYKRASAAPGLKVTSRAFGIGRKCPSHKSMSINSAAASPAPPGASDTPGLGFRNRRFQNVPFRLQKQAI